MLTSVASKTTVDFSGRVGTALLPVDAFIEKPVKPAELFAKIEELFARCKMSSGGQGAEPPTT
jgi:hypothetical protein